MRTCRRRRCARYHRRRRTRGHGVCTDARGGAARTRVADARLREHDGAVAGDVAVVGEVVAIGVDDPLPRPRRAAVARTARRTHRRRSGRSTSPRPCCPSSLTTSAGLSFQATLPFVETGSVHVRPWSSDREKTDVPGVHPDRVDGAGVRHDLDDRVGLPRRADAAADGPRLGPGLARRRATARTSSPHRGSARRPGCRTGRP